MKFEIKQYWSGKILFSLECGSLKFAVEVAVEHGVYLIGAQLNGTYLKDANLRGAHLKYADLRGADLRGADLTDADLRGAHLNGADFMGADLTGADLKGAHLNGALGLKDAIVDGEPLKHATPEESIANLDKVREIILDNQDRLAMGIWHAGSGWRWRTCAEEATCGTAHCLAGWLQVCATDPKVRDMDTHRAGITQAPVAAKMFFRSDSETLAWLKDRKYAEEAADYA